MGNESARSLREAESLLARLGDPMSERAAVRINLEDVSRRLLLNFEGTAQCRFFTAFYRISKDLFLSYATHQIRHHGCPLDSTDLVNRMYILLFEKLLSPNEEVPLDYLFPWCYKVISNLVREEKRNWSRSKRLIRSITDKLASPSPVDDLIEKENRNRDQARLKRVLYLLYSDQAELSRRDQKIMRLFYIKGWSRQKISEAMGLTKAHISVILMRTRRRIARRLAKEF
jgi:RNA polymerase sigma factor (sigma-70 family)